jgi:hypothetical protein
MRSWLPSTETARLPTSCLDSGPGMKSRLVGATMHRTSWVPSTRRWTNAFSCGPTWTFRALAGSAGHSARPEEIRDGPADNGSAWCLSGMPDEHWDNDLLLELHQVHGSDFEVMDKSSLKMDSKSGQVRINRHQACLLLVLPYSSQRASLSQGGNSLPKRRWSLF